MNIVICLPVRLFAQVRKTDPSRLVYIDNAGRPKQSSSNLNFRLLEGIDEWVNSVTAEQTEHTHTHTLAHIYITKQEEARKTSNNLSSHHC